MTVVILLGPPGAGKGTQASRIAERLGIPAISTGDIFRANMAEGTEIGKQAQAYMDRGEFVPDSVTNAMVKARLAAPDAADGFLLDGYPRSVEQAHVLRDMLLDLGKSDAACRHLLRRSGSPGGRRWQWNDRRGHGSHFRDPRLGGKELSDATH